MMRTSLLFALIIVTCCTISCTKEDEVIAIKKATNVSNGQAATMIAASLATSSYGLASIKNDITFYAKTLGTTSGKGCGIEDAFAFARQEPSMAANKYNYAVGYKNTVTCHDNLPDGLSSVVINNGSFDMATLSSIHSANSTISLTHLNDANTTNYDLSGVYQTSGTFQTIDATQLAGSSNINISVNNLLVKRSDRAIVSGTASVTLSGTVKSNKNTFEYSGTIVFEGNTAVLDLGGSKYTLDLTTGDAVAL
ncbi:hypothetical protein [Mucilaginibacter myungsuensis]|uniref:Uncharacterized protein n=1 Tax=Mucilaginibacter myungsuensis TaxID=649104 RepID=A0A929L1E1_9SPHI|nr:hypothetical protein [Mucilaginibacter myungsuensis]MBE9662714.1 hypothetical protein [Mucilaginibacter myungsuensis]MDN3598134.1 hypothetical protein [Mucilaginibacter myungsuensis]